MIFAEKTSIKAMYFIFYSDLIISIENDNSNMFIYNANNLTLLRIIQGNYEGGLYIVDNNVVDMYFTGINIYTFEHIHIFENSTYYFHSFNKNYYVVRKLLKDFKAELLLINRYNLVVKDKLNIIGRLILFNNENYIVSISKSNVYCYCDFLLIWQHDLSTLSSYTNYEGKATKGEIRKVYEYEDSVIVITQMYIFRISIASGDIIYHKKLPAGMLSLSIHQNKAYGCYGHHYLELDLNSGEVVLFYRIEQEEYKGDRFFAYMNEAFYYEGLVYHGIRLSNGVHGVGIIDSSTGKRIWFHPTGVHNIETIKFHQNRLYVKDAGACLHIFEKE